MQQILVVVLLWVQQTEPPAWAASQIEAVQVQPLPKRGRFRLKWSAVKGAPGYELQIARNLTFASTAFRTVTERARLITARLPPGLYFIRVRAVDKTHFGPWSAATATALTPSRRSQPPTSDDSRGPAPSRRAGKKASHPTEPLVVNLKHPHDGLFATAPVVEVEGEATKGALVSTAGQTQHATPNFKLPVRLKHGRNALEIKATLGDQTKTLNRVVYYANPARVRGERAKLNRLREQIESLGAVQRELTTTVTKLEGVLPGASANEAKKIAREIEQVQNLLKELDAEVTRALDELGQALP